MNGELEGHLQNIEDFVQIDDKIVTYKWISKVLKVHTNTAKQLLFAYSKKPEVVDKLLVTYIVAGEQHDGKGLNFQLVQEKDLEKIKRTFHKITSTHVYSIQRGTAVSGADIYNADSSYKLTLEDLKFCSIQTNGEIDRREMKVVIPSTPLNAPVSTKTASKKEAEPVSQDTKLSSQKGVVPLKAKDVPSNKEEVKEKPQALKKASPKKNDTKTAPVKGSSIGALFKKQAAKKKDDLSIKAEVKKADEAKNVDAEKASEKTVQSEVKTPNANKSAGKKKRKKPKDSKDSAAKRRKRIQVASDSESSDQESDGNERFPSPEPEPEAPMVVESDEEDIIPSTPLEKGKKRVKKMIDRTYEDEEGFIITKKEYVVESCSDDESAEPPTKKTEVETTNKETKTNGALVDTTPKEKEEIVPSKAQKTKQDPPNKGTNKPGRPATKAKANSTNSPKKQQSITHFFRKT
ncbi:hypothetical protein GE061_011805 [Apolygus lucorum]|uniref:DNA polymerase delta subunit 3 n=1 Tax=Apolygus lucorum TaxID=248454 RepID=A0A8S9XZR2_APOLU|nr:hypothetical protein GE061_011805 [Apolygus lucorum]